MGTPKVMTSYLFSDNGKAKSDDVERTFKLKIAVLGDKEVGKSSLVTRYTKGTFNQIYLHTRGGDMSEKHVNINGISITLTIIDSAGHQFLRSLIKSLYRNVHGILVVYDVTREKTFESLEEWLHQIAVVNTSHPFLMMVGNKNDLTKYKQVPIERALLYSEEKHIHFKEVSAKTGYHVDEAFKELIQGTCRQKMPSITPENSIKLYDEDTNPSTQNHRGCCSS